MVAVQAMCLVSDSLNVNNDYLVTCEICIWLRFCVVKYHINGRRAPGFLELLLSVNVCMRVCLHVCLRVCLLPKLSTTSSVMWCDIDPI